MQFVCNQTMLFHDCGSVSFEIFIIVFYTLFIVCDAQITGNDCIVTQYIETEIILYCRGIKSTEILYLLWVLVQKSD